MYQGPWPLDLGVGPAHRYLVVLYICHAICSGWVRHYVALTYQEHLTKNNGESINLVVACSVALGYCRR